MLRPPNPAGISRLARNRYAQYRRLLGKDRFRLLEIGCGTGELGAEFVKLGVDYTGINIDPRIIERAAANSGGRILHADIFESWLDGEYDAVCLHQVLEHIGDPRGLAGRIAELSRADSILHGDVPNWRRLTSRIDSVVRLNRKRYRALCLPHHQFAYEPGTLTKLFAGYQLAVFDAPVSDTTWGSVADFSVAYRLYAQVSRLLRSAGFTVFLGKKRS